MQIENEANMGTMFLLECCATQFRCPTAISRLALTGLKYVQSTQKAPFINEDVLNLSRGFQYSAVQCKYHDLRKARIASKKKMSLLQARLDRLDKEDRPSGCILCPMRNDIEIDYKNVRLLSQFVSPHTGRIYGQAVTGLCAKKQREVAKAIRRSRNLGFMPVTMKYFEFHNDPKIF